MNFSKPDSLFNFGMKVTIYSNKSNEEGKEWNNLGWFKGGEKIEYFENPIKKEHVWCHFYTLTFSYKFNYDNDTVYFAYSYPYTYSDL